MYFVLLTLAVVLGGVSTENVAFYFRSQARDAFVPLGGTLTLSCAVSTGVEDVTWHWSLHQSTSDTVGIPLDSSTDTLVYGPVTSDLEGKYVTCGADIFGSKLFSRHTNIRVSYLDESFAEEPEDASVSEGAEHVRLNCVAPGGYPAPYVTWEKDGVEVDLANSYVDPLGGLNLINVDSTAAGSYVCVANSFSLHTPVKSKAATLTVEQGSSDPAPDLPVTYDVSFAQSRYMISARRGDTVRVLCGFLGNPTPTFSIKADADDVTEDVSVYGTWANYHDLEGVTTFHCAASNNAGSQNLQIPVEIIGALTVTGGDVDVTISENESTTLVCSGSSSLDVSYSWYLNGEEIINEVSNSLLIAQAKRSDSGMYQCFARTVAAREQTTFAVYVQGIASEPVQVTVTSDEYGLLGEKLQLSCVAAGNPVPSVTWHRGQGNTQQAIPTEMLTTMESFTETLSILNLSELQEEDDGAEYVCKGTNTHLSDSSVTYSAESSLVLNIVAPIPPSISLPSTSTMTSGSALTLICSVDGSPPPQIQWFLDGVVIEGETDEKFVTSGSAGVYSCTATNALGTVSQEVVVESKPVYSGGEIFLILLIVAFLLVMATVGILIVIRREELERRLREARAKEELLLEKKYSAESTNITPMPTTPVLPVEGGLTANGDVTEPTLVSEAECQTPQPPATSPGPQNV